MPTPDPKYLPKAKGKTKTKKARATVAPAFPVIKKRPGTAVKAGPGNPRGHNYVWAN